MFDVVGVTERVEDFLAALAARTGWRESLAGSSAEELKAARNALSYDGDHHRWRWEHLSAEDATVIHNNTRCDAALYAAAVELAGPPSGLGADAALAAAAVSPRDARHQSRALRALISVSLVVKVLEQTIKSVSEASRSRVASMKSVLSAFDTKRKFISRRLKPRSAS